jgi:hypothetical protein
MRGSPGGWGARWLALAATAAAAWACATPVTREDGRWRARASGASIADLAALEPAWRESASPGALLAFAAGDGARAAWVQQCRSAVAAVRPEAHALLVRLEAAEIEREGPVEIAGREGWAVVASTLQAGRRVPLKTVTRISPAGCTDDFLLSAPAGLAAHEPAFDRWWASYADGAAR